MDGNVLVPVTGDEIRYARQRTPSERTPIPKVGDEVLYRHNQDDEVLFRATVIDVQSLDEPHATWGDPRVDGNLWELREGVPVLPDGFSPDELPEGWLEPKPDPWPTLRLVVELAPGRLLQIDTREARVRGSAGWLPLDWDPPPTPPLIEIPWAVPAPGDPPAPAPVQ